MFYGLPKELNIGGKSMAIRSDYRDILTILTALSDPELTEPEKAAVVLYAFYPQADDIRPEDIPEAIKQCFWFVNMGEEERKKTNSPRVMDWEQDFNYIVAPINRVVGTDIRGLEYLHWWTFLSAYYEIGDCLFAQIVRIRNAKAKGKKLEKADREFYRENAEIIELKQKITSDEEEAIKLWTKGGGGNAK